MIKKILIIISSTLLVGVLFFFGVKFYTRYQIGYTKVCVATHQLSQRCHITSDDLVEIEVPKEYLGDDVYLNKDDIIDRYVKLSYSIPKGSFIYKGAIESDIKDLANTLLREHEVNYDLYMSDVKINTANLNKNMYIDLYLTINTNDKPISDLLLSNARITGLYDTNSKPILDYDNDTKIAIISLAVSKDDVSILNKALMIGNINCVINNNAYKMNLSTVLNRQSKIFEYLD